MIDAERWVLAEAWIANGLRIQWSADTLDGSKSWLGNHDEGHYRYAGYGEWEVPRKSGYQPLGPVDAPQMSTANMRHELAHWLVATEAQRETPNFGLVDGAQLGTVAEDWDSEQRAVDAEMVIQSVCAAASRIVALATGARR